jgi:hypothetical protein
VRIEGQNDSYASDFNQVEGNWIGTDPNGTLHLGNHGAGVLLTTLFGATANSYGNEIGGSSAWLGGPGAGGAVPAGVGNTIAFNWDDGAHVQGAHMVGNPIRGNAIYGNGGLGIDLQYPPGYTPQLLSAVSGPTTQVTFSLPAPTYTTLTVDFYASSPADSSGKAQGRRYLGTVTVTVVPGWFSGYFVVGLAAAVQKGDVITATATDYWGNTSPRSLGLTAQ